MHAKAFLPQHVTNYPPWLGSALGLGGVGEVPVRHPDKQMDLLLYKHIAQVTSCSFSRLFSDKMQKEPSSACNDTVMSVLGHHSLSGTAK